MTKKALMQEDNSLKHYERKILETTNAFNNKELVKYLMVYME